MRIVLFLWGCGMIVLGCGFMGGYEFRKWRESREFANDLAELAPLPPDQGFDDIRGAVQPSHIIGAQYAERGQPSRVVLFSRSELGGWMPDLERCDPAAQPDTEGWQLSGDTWLPPVLGDRRPGDPLSQLLWRAALMPAGPPALEAATDASEPEEGTDGHAAR